METLQIRDLRIGNYFMDDEGFFSQVTGFAPFDNSTRCDEEQGCYILLDQHLRKNLECESFKCKPIPLTEEWLLKFGFVNNEHLIFDTYFKKDLSRGRRLIITDIGTPNFMVMIAHGSLSQVGRQDDVITLHNWDYDKDMYVHQLQNLFKVITGEELEVSL